MTARPTRPSRPQYTRAGAFIAFVFCLASGVMGLWIAITGPEVSGGFPLIPHALNQWIGRFMFGVGGLLSLGISILAYRDVRRPAGEPGQRKR